MAQTLFELTPSRMATCRDSVDRAGVGVPAIMVAVEISGVPPHALKKNRLTTKRISILKSFFMAKSSHEKGINWLNKIY